ncbi:MAG: Crp/Fnr family transcriptional regulator [Myxococcota bacterium]
MNTTGAVTAQQIRLVRQHPIWRDASDLGVRALCASATEVRLRPGDHVLRAGEPAEAIHLLVEGATRVYYPAARDRAEITVKLFWAPAAFGDAESILRTRWAECVEALTPGRVLITPAKRYFELMRREPSVCFRQYWDVARRFGVAIHSERSANLAELQDRTIAILVAYALHFGTPSEGGVLIEYALTQDDIGKQVGANRRSIVTILGALYKAGVIERRGRKFWVRSVEGLLAKAESAPPNLSFRTEDRPWGE